MQELYPHVRYAGHSDIKAELLNDVVKARNDKQTCRWVMNTIDQSLRIKETCAPADKAAQWATEHCGATQV